MVFAPQEGGATRSQELALLFEAGMAYHKRGGKQT